MIPEHDIQAMRVQLEDVEGAEFMSFRTADLARLLEERETHVRVEQMLEPWFAKLARFEESWEETYVHPAAWLMAPMAVDLLREIRSALSASPEEARDDACRCSGANYHLPACGGTC